MAHVQDTRSRKSMVPHVSGRSLETNGQSRPVTQWSPWPYYAEDEIEAVSELLRSGKVNYWTGNDCIEFEREYAASVGRRYGIALANGTLALELALKVAGIQPGDEFVVTPRTFIASASCGVIQGARPIFADVDRNSQNITAETIERVLTPKTKAIVAVHLGGYPCDMDPIMDLAQRRGLTVIEDCAQAHGAFYKNRPIGSLGHLAAFSFCQDKIISTGGEGGMLLLDDEQQWKQAWSFKDHGKSYDTVYHKQHPPGFRWLHESFGTNWRMTGVQAVIGRLQLKKLPQWVATRNAHAAHLQSLLADLPVVRIPEVPEQYRHAYYRMYFFINREYLRADWSRDRIMQEANAAGLPCFVGSCGEIYRERAFTESEIQVERLPVAKELAETSLCMPVHPTLTEAEVQRMGEMMRAILEEATA